VYTLKDYLGGYMIKVKVDDLRKKVDELLIDKVEYVELHIMDSFLLDDEKGVYYPKCLSFDSVDGDGGCTDYEDVVEVDVDYFYKFK